MPRRGLTPEELQEVIRRRQARESFLHIQQETGIPRRAAKSAYEAWERTRVDEDLHQARRDVAAEQFRQHVDILLRLAQALQGHLHAPTSPSEQRDAQAVLRELLERDFLGAEDNGGKERNARRNRMLLDALKEHTGQGVRWDALEEWDRSWDACVTALGRLRREGSTAVRGHLLQRPGLEQRAVKDTGDADLAERMAEAALWVAFLGAASGDLQGEAPLAVVEEARGGLTRVTFGKDATRVQGHPFHDRGVAERVAVVCHNAANALWRGPDLACVAAESTRMKEKARELEEALEPLLLRPLLLRTRCRLCPA